MNPFHQAQFIQEVHPPILSLLRSAQPDNVDLAIELLHSIPELSDLRQQLLPDEATLRQLQQILRLSAAPPKALYRYAINVRSLTIRSVSIKTLPENWAFSHRLEELHIEDTLLTHLLSVIYECKALKTLWLPNNQLHTLSESIGTLKNLENLELSDNPN